MTFHMRYIWTRTLEGFFEAKARRGRHIGCRACPICPDGLLLYQIRRDAECCTHCSYEERSYVWVLTRPAWELRS